MGKRKSGCASGEEEASLLNTTPKKNEREASILLGTCVYLILNDI